jgi:hypothetical protein
VWLEPDATMKRLVSSNSGRGFALLAAAWGISFNLTLLLRRGIPPSLLEDSEIDSAWTIVGANVLIGALFGILVLWILSFLFAWVGRLFGGRAGARQIRTVSAWSSVPHLLNLVIAAPVILIGGTALLTASPPPVLRVLALIPSAILALWAVALFIAGLKAVMEISLLRAVAVFGVGMLVIYAVVVATLSVAL